VRVCSSYPYAEREKAIGADNHILILGHTYIKCAVKVIIFAEINGAVIKYRHVKIVYICLLLER